MGKWSNVKVPHLACKVCEYSARSHWKCNVPHVACGRVSDMKDKNQDKPLEESGGFFS